MKSEKQARYAQWMKRLAVIKDLLAEIPLPELQRCQDAGEVDITEEEVALVDALRRFSA